MDTVPLNRDVCTWRGFIRKTELKFKLRIKLESSLVSKSNKMKNKCNVFVTLNMYTKFYVKNNTFEAFTYIYM